MHITNLFSKLNANISLITPEFNRVEEKLFLIEDFDVLSEHYEPFLPGVIVGLQCLEGESNVILDNKYYRFGEGDMLVLLFP